MSDLESRRIHAEEARQFLSNPLFKAMFDGVSESLDGMALSCDPDNKDKAARIIVSKQLLAGLRREIERRVTDGEFAEFEMKEIEGRKRLRLFQR